MAKAIETLSIQLKFTDASSQAVIEKLRGKLKQLEMAASGARPRIMGLRREILAQGAASAKTVTNITAQRTALEALRNEARIGGKAFNRLTEDIKKLDAQMGKSSQASRGRGGTRQATQIAGAVVSGGIFGGPEGALGAIGGAAIGGVEGAFAGAAIGAQLKAIRDLTSEAAVYASQVQKLDIALRGVAGTQDEYSSAIAAARQVTEQFNVPQLDAVRGVTRLAAAVKGAGGPIQDAETTFANVTAAIKATGGSTEDVRGAITAMVQVFSKGKVSAEELSGQLGERLPGAVTMFAKANDMTLPELQENLKKGTVGLNELMRFIEELGQTYKSTASEIADSNAEAGARLAVAVQNMQAEVGAALIPIGAQFQEAFAEFIVSITPFLVENLPRLGNLFLELAKNLDTVAVAAIAALSIFGAAKIAAIIAGIGSIGKALLVLKGKLVAVALANPFTALALAVGVFAGKLHNASKEQARLNNLIRGGTVAEVEAELRSKQTALDQQIQRRLELDPTGQGITPTARMFQEGGAEFIRENQLKDQIQLLRERLRTAQIDATQGAALDSSLFKPFDYKSPTPDSSGGTGGGRRDISEAAANARIAAMRLSKVPLFEREQAIRDQAKLAKLAAESLEPQRKRVELERISLNENEQILAVRKEMEGVFKELGAGVAEQLKLDAELKASLEDRKFELGMISEQEYFQLQLARERKRLEGMGASEEQVEEQLDLFKKLNSQAPEDIIARRIGSLKKEIEGLTNLGNVAVRIGDAIGSSFQQNFRDIISGTKSVKEALSDFFADIAEAFLAMAAEIIAKQLVMITLQTILRALGAVMGGGSSAPAPKDGAAFQGIGTGTLDSLGGAGPIADPKGLFTAPTLGAPVSVSGPFAANGGPAFGGSPMIVGERGPELFIPFTNGSITSSESLGADMANAMAVPFLPGGNRGGTTSQMLNRQQDLRQVSVPFTRTSEAAMMAAAEQQTADAISNPAPLDVRFESQSINGVEYVTAEQHQRGMAQAAERGRALTLAALQNSVKTRQRVGL